MGKISHEIKKDSETDFAHPSILPSASSTHAKATVVPWHKQGKAPSINVSEKKKLEILHAINCKDIS